MNAPMFRKQLRSTLHQLQELPDWSLKQLAADAGIDYQHLCKQLRFGTDMKLSTFLKLLQAAGITPEELLAFIRQKTEQRIHRHRSRSRQPRQRNAKG